MDSNPQHGAMFGPEEMENPNDTPTVAEYKKLKRVMRIMIKVSIVQYFKIKHLFILSL